MKRLRMILATFIVTLGLVFGGLFVSAPPAQAYLSLFQEVTSSKASETTFSICRDGAWSSSTGKYCRNGWGSLKPGEYHGYKYGWIDIDYVRVSPGCAMTIPYPPRHYSRWNSSTGAWFAPPAFNHSFAYYECKHTF